jgi:purine-nucleoside phosphorylase
MLEQIKETASFLKEKTGFGGRVGIILGTGLGGLVNEIKATHSIPYEQIPNFPLSTVEGHSGRLIFGTLGSCSVVAMQGRFHYYEGYDMKQCTFPVRVMRQMGIDTLIVSNASGGVNPDFEIGELMILNDHINLFPTNPLIGRNLPELGVRFPDMSDVYDADLRQKAKEIAARNGIKVSEGVYLGLSGPCLETPAEYRMVRILGADAVGMSTVPEAIVARHAGMRVFAISIVTDLGVPGRIVKVTHQDVIEVASRQEPKMTLIMKELVGSMG